MLIDEGENLADGAGDIVTGDTKLDSHSECGQRDN